MSTNGFVNEIDMPQGGEPISIREKPKPMRVTVQYFQPDATLEVFEVKRVDLAKPNQAAKDLITLASISGNLFTLNSLWLAAADDPAPGTYRVICVVGTATDKEEINLIVKVVL